MALPHLWVLLLALLSTRRAVDATEGQVWRLNADSQSSYPRQVVSMLTVDNGLPWGDWQPAQFCPTGTYVTDFQLKMDKVHYLRADDTAMNGISLRCRRPHSHNEFSGSIESQPGPWGRWLEPRGCSMGDLAEEEFYMVAFQLQVEPSRGRFGDDTAVNNMKVKCRQLNARQSMTIQGRGGPWGRLGQWSDACPYSTAVCAIQVRLQSPRGNGDDSALTDVRLFCCKDFRVLLSCTHNLRRGTHRQEHNLD